MDITQMEYELKHPKPPIKPLEEGYYRIYRCQEDATLLCGCLSHGGQSKCRMFKDVTIEEYQDMVLERPEGNWDYKIKKPVGEPERSGGSLQNCDSLVQLQPPTPIKVDEDDKGMVRR